MIFAATALLLIGCVSSLIAALGLLRFPHLYARLHAGALAGPFGAGPIILGLGIASDDVTVLIRCLLGVLLLFLVAPLSAHLLGRAAFRIAHHASNSASIEEPNNSF